MSGFYFYLWKMVNFSSHLNQLAVIQKLPDRVEALLAQVADVTVHLYHLQVTFYLVHVQYASKALQLGVGHHQVQHLHVHQAAQLVHHGLVTFLPTRGQKMRTFQFQLLKRLSIVFGRADRDWNFESL